ncbi:MAG: hypothetical protein ACXWEY_14980 [Bacteroidia bacterium]
MDIDKRGVFEVVDSFAIKRRNEFYLIGNLKEGEVQPNWFINIPLNKTLSLTVRIKEIEDIVFSSDDNAYKLIILNEELEFFDLLLGLNIGSELLNITISGKD